MTYLNLTCVRSEKKVDFLQQHEVYLFRNDRNWTEYCVIHRIGRANPVWVYHAKPAGYGPYRVVPKVDREFNTDEKIQTHLESLKDCYQGYVGLVTSWPEWVKPEIIPS